jgi:hypothetical protein
VMGCGILGVELSDPVTKKLEVLNNLHVLVTKLQLHSEVVNRCMNNICEGFIYRREKLPV